MAGWSKIVDGSALGCLKTLQKLRKTEFSLDLDSCSKSSIDGAEEEKLRCLFEQLLRVFLKEIYPSDCFRPLPPMLGNGQAVDLFKLYLVVREKNGLDTVLRGGLWDAVAEELGLDSGVGSALKLVYLKYLDTLDRWLQRIVRVKESKGSLLDCGSDLSGCLMELEPEFGRASNHQKRGRNCSQFDLEKSELNLKDFGKLSNVESDEVRKTVDDTKIVCDGEDSTISVASVATEQASNRKRKRDCHQRILDWVVKVAKDPSDPEVGSLPDKCKWKTYGSDTLWKHVLMAREALFLKRNAGTSADQSNWLMKQRMHPSMYDDQTERLRSSQRIVSAKESPVPSSKKSRVGDYSESSSGTQSDLEDNFGKESNLTSAYSLVGLFTNTCKRKRVPLGPLFQANIPEWIGDTCGYDARWLGSRDWPLESGEHKRHLIERERMGKGRQDSCGCQYPGSAECVRFHVAEKRMRVKLELGSAFYSWKLDKMGEQVALFWTKEEEERFQEIIKANPPSLERSFWDEMFKSFPSKSREDLVSYYFNVFLLRHRGQQNRSTPRSIDSDVEESEFGPLTNGFGRKAVNSPGSIFRSPIKTQNSRK